MLMRLRRDTGEQALLNRNAHHRGPIESVLRPETGKQLTERFQRQPDTDLIRKSTDEDCVLQPALHRQLVGDRR